MLTSCGWLSSIPELVIRMKRAVFSVAMSFGAAIPHAGAQTADHLVDHFGQSPLIRYAGGDPFRNQLFDIVLHVLEITVFRSLLHRLERTHAAISLEFTSVVDDRLAGRLLDAASNDPAITASAPAANALTISPE